MSGIPSHVSIGDTVHSGGEQWRVIRVDHDLRAPSVTAVSRSGKSVLTVSKAQLEWSEQRRGWVHG
jgi:hypothetical protein